ncbi:alpha-ketoglutarate-dependent dioxygenase AlkB family protein [Pseudomonas sp. 5P_3.1_Bac2]|uniref:alpha-ketoglutarate-dependent dioxygenase AlkB family protein n=1 Tax=Pseudomonas sp. 5P_3.1_Bac2 TaxID=2971617 RepID=UPI0021C60D54|nr:alpha-ketoglutarate-dependent dioxygenase AlkB [Pseudomonas sp. 5P_3.1_Bac2]MCU1716455.1 alpha-ketoglutarate-dependent dioxygenase AlkB [Pseudomonas sp. 5P_3.1_Bac2]
MDLFAEPQLPLANAELSFYPDWLDAATAAQWLQALVAQTPWQQPRLVIYGREVTVPRLVAWYCDADVRYGYSGFTHETLPWTPLLAHIREDLEQRLGQRFNGVLLNYYRDGQDSMGWHSDDETELGRNPVIASLNLGGTRRFDLRRVGENRIAHSLPLTDGSLLVMAGATQHHWQHQVAKTRSLCTPRLNLTFRLVRPTHEH